MNYNLSQKQYQANFESRKKALALSRSAISEEKWINYIQNAYPLIATQTDLDKISSSTPILGKNIPGKMWDFKIIFYPKNGKNLENISIVYYFRTYRFSSMSDILFEFSKFIQNQHLILKLIFGNDIYNLIKNYLPDIYINQKNYLYIHRHQFNHRGEVIGFNRTMIPSNLKLNCIRQMVDMNQDLTIINLRLRSNPVFKQEDFLKSFDYDSGNVVRLI